MASVLDEILEKIKEGVAVIADRTDEYSKIGKLKVEMVSLKRNVEATFTALGGRVYRMLEGGAEADVAADAEVKEYVEKIKRLEKELAEKKEKVEEVRRTKSEERKQRAADKQKAGGTNTGSDQTIEVDAEEE